MQYKLLYCVFVLLIATPVLGQEYSPIIVETGKPTPSVVKTGEPFKVTYRAKFLDTVIIIEDQMRPDNLTLDQVEVTGLDIKKEPPGSYESLGIVNVWDFTYTFRIIQPEKKVYKIPSFSFIWVEKKAGVVESRAKEKGELKKFPTEEVGINYVSSIVKPPFLDIRDEINFVSPIADGVVWRRRAYGVIAAASLWVLIIMFRFFRYPKTQQSQNTSREVDTETAEGVVTNMEPVLSPKQARNKFLKELKKLRAESRLDLVKKIRPLVRALLLTELQRMIRASMSENEIYAKLSSLDVKEKKLVGSKYIAMLDLARRLKGYQEDIDSGRYSLDRAREIVELRDVVSDLKLHKRFLSLVKSLLRKRR